MLLDEREHAEQQVTRVTQCLPGRGLCHGSHSRGNGPASHQLYLPEHWCKQTAECKERRNAAHIPPGIEFRTKPEIAADLIRTVAVLDVVRLDWVTADELYGRNGQFLDALEELDHKYVVEVPVTTNVWTTDPTLPAAVHCGRVRTRKRPAPVSSTSVKEVAKSLPAAAWRTLKVADGAKGPLAFEFAAVPIWQKRHGKHGPRGWLMIRRSLDPKPEIKYYVSNASESTPLEVLAGVACSRFRVEEFFEDSKGYLGMAAYETRSWTGWHHHMSLVALAHLFITLVRKGPSEGNTRPELGSNGSVAAGRTKAPPAGRGTRGAAGRVLRATERDR